MKPYEDYLPLEDLADNAKATDFLVGTNAIEIIEGLFEGRIEIVKAHLRQDKNGYFISVPAYLRKKRVYITLTNNKQDTLID